MRLPSTLLVALLPTLISADDQAPLKDKAGGWFDKAKQYVSSVTPDLPNPIDAGAAKVAEYKVEKLNIRNWERKLGPKPEGEEEWMIYVTGGNKTCHGRCQRPDTIWNESVPLLLALQPFSGSTLRLGQLNCEAEEILCTAWGVAVPSIFHFIFPQKVAGAQSQAPSPLHEIAVNASGVTTSDFVAIPRASESKYLEVDEYVGAMHPIDGWLKQFGLLHAVGWILWGFGTTPSWLFMIAISFFSRQMMARKAQARAQGVPQVGTQRAATAPPPAGAGTGANPAGGRGGAKKRK